MKHLDGFCLSSYLAFRYVAKKNHEWLPGVRPEFPSQADDDLILVGSSQEILSTLRRLVASLPSIERTGIFLSGGIDSAILAALLPEGTIAYTINFMAASGANEGERAVRYARQYNLKHKIIQVNWEDYEEYEPLLMSMKKSPLHPVEVALYKASFTAKTDGVETIILGNGADSTFGGLDRLLSKDWTFEDFMARYTFVNPASVLKEPASIHEVYEPYRRGENIDYIEFLKKVHGIGVIQAFNNSTRSAGISVAEPFERMKLKGGLDLHRIRAGEPKYLLVDVFKELYPGITIPCKIPFARPMDEWLVNYSGPKSEVFRSGLDMSAFTGDQKYLIRCLDRFIELLEAGKI